MSNSVTTPRADWTPERVAALVRNIAAIAAIGVTLGVFAASVNLYYVGAGVAAAALIIMASWQFEAALVLYALLAFVPWGQTPNLAVGGSGMGKGVFVSELMLAFLLVIWWGKYLFGALAKDRIPSGFHIPIILYVAYGILNVVNSYIFWDPHINKMYQYPQVNAIEIGFRVLSAGAFAMMATSISSERWLKWTTAFILIPGAYNLFNSLASHAIPLTAPWWPLLTVLPASYCLAIMLDSERSPITRAAAGAFVVLAMGDIFIGGIGWVSGWLALLPALAVVAFIKNRKFCVIVLAAALIVVVAAWPYFYKNVVVDSEEGGDFDRFSLASGALKYATTFPLGVGLETTAHTTPSITARSGAPPLIRRLIGTYSQHLSETGVPGLALFASILVGGFLWLLRSYREMEDRGSKTFLLAVIGQLAGIACAASIGDYIIPTYHNGGIFTFSATVYSWLIWGLAVAHVRLRRQQSVEASEGAM